MADTIKQTEQIWPENGNDVTPTTNIARKTSDERNR